MKDVRIINYTPDYYNALSLYKKKVWPNGKMEYVDYSLRGGNGNEVPPHLLVLNERNEIVGCHLFFSTKALIYGEECAVYWGHDTFLDEEYRGDGGTMLMLEMQKIPHFGMGLSAVNQKIQRVLKSAFFKEIILYGAPNIFFIRSLSQFLMKKKIRPIDFIHPKQLKIEKQYFTEVKEATALKIPNNGYWCKGKVDIDFIRDCDYLSTRFFHNFNSYSFYHLITEEEYDSCYFVVRPILYKKMPALSIVDFRYDLAQPEQFSLILKAAQKIAKLNKIGLVLYLTNLGDGKPLMKFANCLSVLSLSPLLLRKTQEMDYVATSSYRLPSSATSVATGADADYDFLRREIGE